MDSDGGLTLRVPTDADALRWWVLFADPEVMRYLGDGSVRDVHWYEEFVSHQQHLAERTGICLYSALLDGEVIGFAGVQPWTATWGPTGTPELGWRLGRRYWGRGLATAAGRQVYALARQNGIGSLVSLIEIHNRRSAAVATRLGMRLHSEHRAPNGERVIEFRSESLLGGVPVQRRARSTMEPRSRLYQGITPS
jgi:RimJ/RimL family protein N-acetyltransferase